MSMLTRRQFFGGQFLLRKSKNTEPDPAEELQQHGDSRHGADAVSGDFPPEMLAMEAKRLGLHPDTMDRSTLLTAIYETMNDSARRPPDG